MFCEFGLKMPIPTPFWVFFGEFDHLDVTQYQPIWQKFHLRVITVQQYITYTGVYSSSRETAWTKMCDEEEEEEHEFLGVFDVFLK